MAAQTNALHVQEGPTRHVAPVTQRACKCTPKGQTKQRQTCRGTYVKGQRPPLAKNLDDQAIGTRASAGRAQERRARSSSHGERPWPLNRGLAIWGQPKTPQNRRSPHSRRHHDNATDGESRGQASAQASRAMRAPYEGVEASGIANHACQGPKCQGRRTPRRAKQQQHPFVHPELRGRHDNI